MTTRKTKILAASTFVLVASGGYLIHSLMAAQAQGGLAQAPLNVQVQTPAAFIMAVDDSNSMTFERMFPGGDGRMQWNSTTKSFFSSAGVFSNVGAGCSNNSYDCFLYLYPHSNFNSSYSPGRAIPPLDVYGFARSPTYNASYFNPAETYEPWKNADGTSWANATITAARVDPRSGYTGYGTTYDLTSNRASTSEPFQFASGMSIPNLSGTGTSYWVNTLFGGEWRTAAVDNPGNNTYAFNYFPATFYLPESAAAPTGYKTDNANRPVITGACGPSCNMRRYQIKADNYSSTAAYTAAIQNFANWFQYHRNRILAMVGSSSHAMVDVSNMRVGYFTINNLKQVTMYDMATNRADLYKQIYTLAPSGGTPNRKAVEYLAKQFARTDTDAPVQYACQRNGGMLFTDGYTNSGNTVSGYANADGSGGTYFPTQPFADGYSNTIADIAAYYYAGAGTPLRTGTNFPTGQVSVSEQCSTLDKSSAEWKAMDCQANLHMNFYGVTLGATGRIYGVNAAATADPYKNPPNWNGSPDPSNSDDGTVIDELWHAALNSRGEFINAQTPAEVTNAMRRVLSSITAGSSPSGTVAMTGQRIGLGSLTVVPRYDVTNDATDWSSRLTASTVTVNSSTQVAEYTDVWEAASKLTSSGRTIVANKAGTPGEFSSGALTLTDLCTKPSGLYADILRCNATDLATMKADIGTAITYLKGDSTKELKNSGIYRDRTTALGDIVNSTPLVSSPLDDYGYRQLGTTWATSYTAYLATKAKSARYMVYVGANDGMLHAFDGGMAADGKQDTTGGKETFAYIPATSLGHMANLLIPHKANNKDQTFQHRYYVDGPITVGDTYYGGAWHTSLVGTTGAGGRSVFALDVGAPSSFSKSNVLWELSDVNTSLDASIRNNLGFVLGKPVIVPVQNGTNIEWKAIFGNGYNSKNGNAVLFVVDMATGAVRQITAQEKTSTPAISGTNGLGNIVVVDRWRGTGQATRGRDGVADTVYAADQRGAVWKFDLRDSTNATVTVPVFTSATHTETSGSTTLTYRQPITGGLTAATGTGGGVMLFFGTGSFSFTNDVSDMTAQALYGVNDTSTDVPTSTITSSNLLAYDVVSTTTDRTLKVNTSPTSAKGWKINLPTANGERFVGNPTIAAGILFLPTYVPKKDVQGCSTGGSNWLFGLDTLTGAGALSQTRYGSPTGKSPASGSAAVSLDTKGTAPVRDVSLSVIPRLGNGGAGGSGPPGGNSCWMVVGAAGASPMYVPYPCGRQSWRQIQ